MKLFTISDLHLSFGSNKPMDIFRGWENHAEKIEKNWKKLVSDEDIVVLIGDTSWAINFEQLLPDFAFINSLPGTKIIIKGNHDYWWSTITKINQFLSQNKFDSIKILHNNAFLINGISVCGTRGWLYDGTGEKDEKVVKRECGRLITSIKEGIKLGGKLIAFLHYPPAYGEFVCEEFINILNEYNIKQVYYGHIHGMGFNKSLTEIEDIKLKLVSCDCIEFTPIMVK